MLILTKKGMAVFMKYSNLFVPNAPLLHLLKTSENRKVDFRRYRKSLLETNNSITNLSRSDLVRVRKNAAVSIKLYMGTK